MNTLKKVTHNEQGLLQFGHLKFRQPVTEVDNCNIADVLFISQINNVKPELKYNSEQKLRLIPSSPNCSKPNVLVAQLTFCL
ncbi:MAG: hypothetical protein JSS98_07285 [Bacteroidetes bacterium]|nr:hypothetical protein [Bacteroidota bacterium]